MGQKAFEQCAGYENSGWKNPLDATSVHPESYEAAEKLLEKQGFTNKRYQEEICRGFPNQSKIIKTCKNSASEKLRCAFKIGKPGRDPRDEIPKPILQNDVLR